ncbi:RNA polymerase sigma factor SigZ [Gorillibacterium timonense]|uniref:RNA polymerase sigma factor SigZ n=1 Tax=Gorillibacterium timonense TaxID=1689269 RepID=UPI00071D9765|nr:RNA polymerase sigma factor SigZ [Gorillibacterium timonense]
MKYTTENIWQEFNSSLRSFISKKVSNPSVVEDLLQDVFIKIHTNIDSLKEDIRVRSWVYQITRNTIIDYYRKHKNKEEDIDAIPLVDQGLGSSENDWIEFGPAHEVAAGLLGMIHDLPVKYSQALILVEFEELTMAELASTLGISVSGAKSRVQRGREMLRNNLMKCCHFELDRFGTIINIHPLCSCCSLNEK